MSGHVALFTALFLGGIATAGCSPEPTAPAAEPQAPVPQAAVQQAPVEQTGVQQAPVQQATGELTVFSCQLGDGKVATVTRDGERFLYRYGPVGQAELTIEGTAANGRIFKRASVHGGTYDIQLRFVSGEYSYIVHSFPRSDIVDNEPRSGLMVFRGGEKIMDRNCAPWAEISFGDFDYLNALPDIPADAPSAWGE